MSLNPLRLKVAISFRGDNNRSGVAESARILIAAQISTVRRINTAERMNREALSPLCGLARTSIQTLSGFCYSLLLLCLSKFLDGFPQLVQLGTQLFVFIAKLVNLITNLRSMGLH
jgi:hypothetical protein